MVGKMMWLIKFDNFHDDFHFLISVLLSYKGKRSIMWPNLPKPFTYTNSDRQCIQMNYCIKFGVNQIKTDLEGVTKDQSKKVVTSKIHIIMYNIKFIYVCMSRYTAVCDVLAFLIFSSCFHEIYSILLL